MSNFQQELFILAKRSRGPGKCTMKDYTGVDIL